MRRKVVECCDPVSGLTPLLIAAAQGHLEVVKLLVTKAGASLNQTNKLNQRSALFLAAFHNRKEVFEWLLNASRFFTRPPPQKTESEHPEERASSKQLASEETENPTCLWISATENKLECQEQEKVDVLHFDGEGRTALHLACYEGALSISRMLLQKEDARWLLLQRDIFGCTALHYAVAQQKDACIELLLEMRMPLQKQLSLLQIAIDRADECQIERLERNNPIAAAVSCQLKAASKMNRVLPPSAVVAALFLNAPDNRGRTALSYAVEMKNPEVSEYLLEEGASMDKNISSSGFSLVHLAIDANCPAVLQLILQRLNPSAMIEKIIRSIGCSFFDLPMSGSESLEELLVGGTLSSLVAHLMRLKSSKEKTGADKEQEEDELSDIQDKLQISVLSNYPPLYHDHYGLSPLMLAVQLNRLDCLRMLFSWLLVPLISLSNSKSSQILDKALTEYIILLQLLLISEDCHGCNLLHLSICAGTQEVCHYLLDGDFSTIRPLLNQKSGGVTTDSDFEDTEESEILDILRSPLGKSFSRLLGQHLLESTDVHGRTPLFYASIAVPFVEPNLEQPAVEQLSKESVISVCDADKGAKKDDATESSGSSYGTPRKPLKRISSLARQQQNGYHKWFFNSSSSSSKRNQSICNQMIGLIVESINKNQRQAAFDSLCLRDNKGRTALHYAVLTESFEAVSLLVQTFINLRQVAHKDKSHSDVALRVDLFSSDGLNPLHIAAAKGNNELCRLLLLQGGIDVNCMTQLPHPAAPSSALHLAVIGGHLECVQLLLATGANPFLCDGKGRSALLLSISSRHTAVCECFSSLLSFIAEDLPRPTTSNFLCMLRQENSNPMMGAPTDPVVEFMRRTKFQVEEVALHPLAVLLLARHPTSQLNCLTVACARPISKDLQLQQQLLSRLLLPIKKMAAYSYKTKSLSLSDHIDEGFPSPTSTRHSLLWSTLLQDRNGWTPLHYIVAGERYVDSSFIRLSLQTFLDHSLISTSSLLSLHKMESTGCCPRMLLSPISNRTVSLVECDTQAHKTLMTALHVLAANTTHFGRDKGDTAVQEAEKCLWLLLEHQYRTKGHQAVERLFLQSDARGRSALHMALLCKTEGVASALLKVSQLLNWSHLLISQVDHDGSSCFDLARASQVSPNLLSVLQQIADSALSSQPETTAVFEDNLQDEMTVPISNLEQLKEEFLVMSANDLQSEEEIYLEQQLEEEIFLTADDEQPLVDTAVPRSDSDSLTVPSFDFHRLLQEENEESLATQMDGFAVFDQRQPHPIDQSAKKNQTPSASCSSLGKTSVFERLSRVTNTQQGLSSATKAAQSKLVLSSSKKGRYRNRQTEELLAQAALLSKMPLSSALERNATSVAVLSKFDSFAEASELDKSFSLFVNPTMVKQDSLVTPKTDNLQAASRLLQSKLFKSFSNFSNSTSQGRQVFGSVAQHQGLCRNRPSLSSTRHLNSSTEIVRKSVVAPAQRTNPKPPADHYLLKKHSIRSVVMPANKAPSSSLSSTTFSTFAAHSLSRQALSSKKPTAKQTPADCKLVVRLRDPAASMSRSSTAMNRISISATTSKTTIASEMRPAGAKRITQLALVREIKKGARSPLKELKQANCAAPKQLQPQKPTITTATVKKISVFERLSRNSSKGIK